jgi:hypothetical protein
MRGKSTEQEGTRWLTKDFQDFQLEKCMPRTVATLRSAGLHLYRSTNLIRVFPSENSNEGHVDNCNEGPERPCLEVGTAEPVRVS